MSNPTCSPIDEPTAGFLLSGLSVSLASCDGALQPSLSRACGIRLADDRRTLRIMLAAEHARRVIDDIRSSARAAAVFSDVDSHRTLQIKSHAVRVEAADELDRDAVRQYLRRFEAQLDKIGFGPAFAQALFGSRSGELVAVVMEPAEFYTQTPGPQAGTRLAAPPA